MKNRTRELIFRLTTAAIGFLVTAMVFGVAVARSQEAPVVAAATVSVSYQTPSPGCFDGSCDRPQGSRH